jgi:diacylglycerol kinase family enzyme
MAARGERLTCILNASAGSDRARESRDRLAGLFAEHSAEATILLASKGEEIPALARRAIEEKSHTIVAAGGDGTINAVAAAAIGTDTPLGVLPLGTLNHFAGDLNIPMELEAAVANVFSGQIARVDVGEVNGRPFLNNSSLGLYPAIVREREKQQRKGHAKWVAFAKAVVFAFRRYSPLSINLHVDDRNQTGRTPFIFVGNNAYDVSGFNIGSRKNLDTGKLWVCRAPHAGRIKLLCLALQTLAGHPSRGDLTIFEANEFWIGANRDHLRVALDGEVATLPAPLHYRSLPKALNVIVPVPKGVPVSDPARSA